jgi:hypothetical protein
MLERTQTHLDTTGVGGYVVRGTTGTHLPDVWEDHLCPPASVDDLQAVSSEWHVRGGLGLGWVEGGGAMAHITPI